MREDDGDLSDGQISELLKDAERRLRERASALTSQSQIPSTLPKLDGGDIDRPYVTSVGDIARVDSSRLLDPNQRALSNRIRKVEPPKKFGKQKIDAGDEWFNMPITDPSLKKDFQLRKLRGVLDPKRHYKKETSNRQGPRFSQVGTIIQGPTEYYSARLPNKERRKTFVDEVLAQEAVSGRFKRKYNEIQSAKTSGKKGYYKALLKKRGSKNLQS
ncbi:MAG: hypothetical protein M1827_003850 [Pycnora praestabilis]|nr:MAG: hypothetical protein M1827_003850 [Pycnora praestabilis]